MPMKKLPIYFSAFIKYIKYIIVLKFVIKY
jgi:hypothetical protein